jgi:outer membrane protein OmpA-like peptidoglycan-associated protein
MIFGKNFLKKIEKPINNGLKNAVIGTAMLSGLNEANAVEIKNKDKEITKTEIEAEIKTNKPENAYFVSDVDFTNNSENFKTEVSNIGNKIEFQAISRFNVDSHIILDEAKSAIVADFQELLNNITPENYDQIIKKGINILAYSDPRKTNKYKDNEELSFKRANAMKEILVNYLKKDAYFINLSPEQNEKIRNIDFSFEIPESKIVKNAQKGVMNPEDKGINTEGMTEEQLIEVYDKYCRGVIVSIELENIKKEPLKSLTPQIPSIPFEKVPPKINWNAKYKVIDIDNSPSVGRKNKDKSTSFEYMINVITNDVNLEQSDINLRFFSNKLGKSIVCKGKKELFEEIRKEKFKGDTYEKTLDTSNSSLEEMPQNSDEKVLTSLTDEALQAVTLNKVDKLEKLSKEKNAGYAVVYITKDKKVRIIDIKEIKSISEKQLINDIKATLKEYIKGKNLEIQKMNDLKLKKENQNQILSLQESIEKNSLEGILNNPLLREVYVASLYPDLKGYIYNRIINPISLENAGIEVSSNNKI